MGMAALYDGVSSTAYTTVINLLQLSPARPLHTPGCSFQDGHMLCCVLYAVLRVLCAVSCTP